MNNVYSIIKFKDCLNIASLMIIENDMDKNSNNTYPRYLARVPSLCLCIGEYWQGETEQKITMKGTVIQIIETKSSLEVLLYLEKDKYASIRILKKEK